MMKHLNINSDKLLRAAVLLLLVAVVVMSFVTFSALERRDKVQNAVTELCGKALTDIELNLRQGDEILPEYLYRYHEITQVYPDTNYAVLADTLMVLEDTSLSSQLSQSDRDRIADCIAASNVPDIEDDALEPLIYEIETVLAPYLYP